MPAATSYKTVTVVLPSCQRSVVYLIGKNAQGNFDILDRAHPQDLWFHVDGQPSGHVIACLDPTVRFDKPHLREVITQGALLCKLQSRYRSQPSLEIVYSLVKYVEKAPIPGTVQVRGTTLKCKRV